MSFPPWRCQEKDWSQGIEGLDSNSSVTLASWVALGKALNLRFLVCNMRKTIHFSRGLVRPGS